MLNTQQLSLYSPADSPVADDYPGQWAACGVDSRGYPRTGLGPTPSDALVELAAALDPQWPGTQVPPGYPDVELAVHVRVWEPGATGLDHWCAQYQTRPGVELEAATGDSLESCWDALRELRA